LVIFAAFVGFEVPKAQRATQKVSKEFSLHPFLGPSSLFSQKGPNRTPIYE
jgi:hypothetical protein